MEQRPSLESTLKSSDTEEFIDIYFYRPIGYRWALFFRRLHITPNAITIASIFIGIGAGICFYFTNLWVTILGIILLIWANSFDSADGQLARMTSNYSTLGRILDGVAGDLWFATIYICIAIRLTESWGIYIWILALISGFFHSEQAAMADYYRNIHLLFLKGKSELQHSEDVRNEYKELKWKKNGFTKVFMFFYRLYTHKQEYWSPNFQIMLNALKNKYGNSFPKTFCEDFRKKSMPLMKWTNILSFNTRAIVLFISLLIQLPWIYFIFELVVLNSFLIYMVKRHEKICSSFTKKIKNNTYTEVMKLNAV